MENRIEQADHGQLKVCSRDILFASNPDEMFKQELASSLVGDKGVLAENLESWAQKERHQGIA
ncbi:hypothetical protein HALA3H3_260002 [Halomonas sp. A3H3]|uniref:hypothetical protein n=1 Tax=Halomonas sp. A3H3 TaxID=1346287 RepID=UPI00038D58FE|nr:hypothetical protein [Halomonas sp. A3H3]CDG51716.1 hypothetical protein HALA3H3_260002 [Halomonas sp. A3H3]